MSLIDDTMKQGERAVEQATDHTLDRVESNAPGTLLKIARAILDACCEYEFVIGLRKKS